MSTSTWRSETEGRLRKAQVSLEAARALIDRKPPCNDDAVNRASAAALQAARALVDARWPPRDQPWDPTWRPGMPPLQATGPYSKASWPVILQQFERASTEMALPFDAAEHLKALLEDGLSADVGDSNAYENEEAVEAVTTADKLVKSVTHSLPLAFALGYRELDGDGDFESEDDDENATTLEVMPIQPHPTEALAAAAVTDPHVAPVKTEEAAKPAPPASAATPEAAPATPPAVTQADPALAAAPSPAPAKVEPAAEPAPKPAEG